jgi:hypothetical protein
MRMQTATWPILWSSRDYIDRCQRTSDIHIRLAVGLDGREAAQSTQ